MAGAAQGPAYPAFGEFVKTQRALAQLSLRQASAMARISNPYLSQIEHGWVLPSVAVMAKLAEAFSTSAEAFLREAAVAANGTVPTARPSTEDAIQQDDRLSVEQRKALLLILGSFTGANPTGAAPESESRPKKPRDTSEAAASPDRGSRSRKPRPAMLADASSKTQQEGATK